MDANKKQALKDLLLFKFGVTNTFDNTKERLQRLQTRLNQPFRPNLMYVIGFEITEIILKTDTDEGYVTVKNDVYTRQPRDTDGKLVYSGDFDAWLTAAAENVVKYIEELQDGVREPLCNIQRKYAQKDRLDLVDGRLPRPIREYLDASELIKTIYEMPVLRGIYYSEDINERYWKEITKEELFMLERGEVLYRFDEERWEIYPVEHAKDISETDKLPDGYPKFYLPKRMPLLGYANSTYNKPNPFKCNRFYLCQDVLLKTIKKESVKDAWEDNGYYKETFYHELAHCFFGHGGNGKDGKGDKVIESSRLGKVVLINYWDEQDAQTFASVFFSDEVASQHILKHSKSKPREYQNMPLWGLYKEITTVHIEGTKMKTKTNEELLMEHVAIIEELKARNVVRTNNNPIGDYAEWLVDSVYGLTLERNSNAGYDAKDNSNPPVRYQIKARREGGNGYRELSAIRNYAKHDFDILIAIIFDKNFKVKEAYSIPYATVGKYGRFTPHTNSITLILDGALLKDSTVKDILADFGGTSPAAPVAAATTPTGKIGAGRYIRGELTKLLNGGMLSSTMLANLQSKAYCSRELGISYAVLVDKTATFDNARYYKGEVCGYYICSQWYDRNVAIFNSWRIRNGI